MSFRHRVLGIKFLALVTLCIQGASATDYKMQTLEQAHEMFRSATNSAMYAEAAQQYEFLVTEEGVQNGHLFYTLGNCWFMAGDPGRAILNYRRAEQYLPNDADVQHNLRSALDMRTDLIPSKERPPLAAKLLGWHFDTSTALRWWSFVICWLVFWMAYLLGNRSPKKEIRITTVVAGILSLTLLASLLTEYFVKQANEPGVIIAADVLARKGDGDRYAPAFLEPLHSGTEFQRLDDRGVWWQIRLADGQTCWVPSSAAEMITLLSE